jgi:hypothetical protein
VERFDSPLHFAGGKKLDSPLCIHRKDFSKNTNISTKSKIKLNSSTVAQGGILDIKTGEKKIS